MSLFSVRLKTLRKEAGETQNQLAMYLNVKRTTISAYESERNIPPYDKVKKLADRYNVDVDYLMGNVSTLIKRNIDVEAFDVESHISLLMEFLSDDKSTMCFKGKSLSNKQKLEILQLIESCKNLIENISKYE